MGSQQNNKDLNVVRAPLIGIQKRDRNEYNRQPKILKNHSLVTKSVTETPAKESECTSETSQVAIPPLTTGAAVDYERWFALGFLRHYEAKQNSLEIKPLKDHFESPYDLVSLALLLLIEESHKLKQSMEGIHTNLENEEKYPSIMYDISDYRQYERRGYVHMKIWISTLGVNLRRMDVVEVDSGNIGVIQRVKERKINESTDCVILLLRRIEKVTTIRAWSNLTPSARMFTAINKVPHHENTKLITGKTFTDTQSFIGDPSAEAVRLITQSKEKLVMIQGPPGTGKTYLIVCAIEHLVQRGKRVLIVASSNQAVATVASRWLKRKVRVSAVIVGTEEKMRMQGVESITLSEVKRRRSMKAKNVIANSRLVFATLSACGKESMLQNNYYDVVILDEAAQSIEAETLIVFQYNFGKIVLVGDPKQLCGTVTSKDAQKAQLDRSLMDRLMKNNYPYVMLTTQYRMHPEIAAFPNDEFYGGKLHTVHLKKYNLEPLIFLDVKGDAIKDETGSKSNLVEADTVYCEIDRLQRKGIDPKLISVITFYKSQVKLINEGLTRMGLNKEIKVSTVDGFQGQENDFIIVSFVASGEIGFVSDPLRLNVALTRARHSLLMIGDKDTLCKANCVTQSLIRHLVLRKCIIKM